jgi:hypothetical protein
MPRLVSVEEVQRRKQALVEKSELYRQTLRFEAHNLELYFTGLTRKVNKVTAFNPLMILATPLLKSFLARKLRKSKLGLIAKGFLAWRLYRQLSPLLRGVFSRHNGAPHKSEVWRVQSAQ